MNKFLQIFELKNAFIFSIILGFINWFMFYIILPINTTSLSFETLSFIASCVICFIIGYYLFSFHKTTKYTLKPFNYFIIFAVIAAIGLTIRYIDFFFLKDIKWNNPYHVNRFLKSNNATQPHLLITLFSTLRVLYFIPLLILIIQKSKNKIFWVVAVFLIICSGITVFLFGTRKPFFDLAILIFVSFFYYQRKKLKPSKKTILVIIFSAFALSFFSYIILNKRMSESSTEKNALVKVAHVRYNDFVEIKDFKLNQIEESPQSLNSKAQIMFIHTGQYIIHGFFELDYIVNNDFPKAKGLYSFNPIFKLLNRLGLTKNDLSTNKYHPRDYVYTSYFGSFFIDFGWFSLIFMFLFGVFQNWVFILAKTNIIAKVFFVILLGVNLTMPIFNLLAGAGSYMFIFILCIMCYSLKIK